MLNLPSVRIDHRRSIYRRAEVACSEMADDLERTVERIAEDENADQQSDNSRQHKMDLERIWSGFEQYCDFSYVREAWKVPSFLPNEVSFHSPSRQLIRLTRILPLPSTQPDSCQQTVWLYFVYSAKFWRSPAPDSPWLNSAPAAKRMLN